MKNRMQLLFRGMSAAGLAVTLLVMGCSGSTAVKPAVDKTVALSPAAGSPQGGVPQEGIKVHGHWTIEVRNADGTVAEVRDFENALTSSGSAALSNFLGRTRSVGGWLITLYGGGPVTTGAFQTGPGIYQGIISEIGGQDANSGPGYFATLTVNAPSTGVNAGKLVLSGTATAQLDGDIRVVSTSVTALPNTQVPAAAYGGLYSFTSTNLAAPITLLAGQQVLVTVVISFS